MEGVREIRTVDDSQGRPERVPRDIITDIWTGVDLGAVILRHTNNQGFETDAKMANLRRDEPPAHLFQVPPDYMIEDERQDFFIAIPARGRSAIPEVISRVQPRYTGEALNSGIQGVVVVAVVVDEVGKPRELHIERSIDPGLDQAALKAVSQWRFRPGEEDGHRVPMNVKVEIKFGIN